MAMDQYLLIQFLVGWTSIYQLFWCSPGVQGFDTLPYDYMVMYPLDQWICTPSSVADLLISFDRPWCRAPWLPPSSSRLAGFRGRISHPEAGSFWFSFDFDHSHPSKSQCGCSLIFGDVSEDWVWKKTTKIPTVNSNCPNDMRILGGCNPCWSPIFWRKRWANWRCRLLAAAASVDVQWCNGAVTVTRFAASRRLHDKSGAWWRLRKNMAWCIQLNRSLRKLYIHR